MQRTTHFCARFALPILLCSAALPAMAAGVTVYDPDYPTRILSINEYPTVIEKLINRADFELAEKMITLGLEENPQSAQMRFQRCVLLQRAGRTDEARRAFEDFIARYPEIPEPYNNLAAIYSRLGNLDRAEELLKKSLALRPNFALAWSNLGNLCAARAKNAYATSLKHQPGNKDVRRRAEIVDSLLK